MDVIYTPTNVAIAMVKYARSRERNPIIADFAVGGGELIRAALARWPEAGVVGSDIRDVAVNRLSHLEPSWRLSKCDFLDPSSRCRAAALRNLEGKVDLVLLNPPFSIHGSRKWKVLLKESLVSCSQGLAFVITSISYLRPEGEIVAVLPAGTLHSEMDANAWRLISRYSEYAIMEKNGNTIFRGYSPQTVVVRIKLRKETVVSTAVRATSPRRQLPIWVSVERGKVDMSKLNGHHNGGAVPLVHTTELKLHRADLSKRKTNHSKATLSESAVLLPRVGRPNKGKICLFTENRPVALSACVIAIRCKSFPDAQEVYRKLLANWTMVEKTYGGTCALYLTVNRVEVLLTQLGFQIRHFHCAAH